MHAVTAAGKLEQALERLQEQLHERAWADLPRSARRLALARALQALESVRDALAAVDKALERGHEEVGAAKARQRAQEACTVLARNLELEKKTPPRRLEALSREKDEGHAPDLYSALQERAFSVLLQGRYVLERLNLSLARQRLVPAGKSATREMARLLEAKEEELQRTRAAFERLRRKTFLGFLREENAADLEEELQKLDRDIERRRAQLLERERVYRHRLAALEDAFRDLRERLARLDAVHEHYREKAAALIVFLKKERDFARNVLLQTEAEAMRLRNAYSHGLLSLEEQRQRAREEAEQRADKRVQALEARLREAERLLDHYRAMLQARERALSAAAGKRTGKKALKNKNA